MYIIQFSIIKTIIIFIYANNSTTIEDSGFSYITSTNKAVLGKVVAIEYAENLKVDSAVLKFEIPSSTINSARNYPDSAEFAGLNRYAIFHYSEEYNIMYPVNVEYDEASSTLIVNTDELGDYFVVDLDQWFFEMGIVPDQYGDESEISAFSLDYDEEICYTDSNEDDKKYTIEELEEIFDFSKPFGATEIVAEEQLETTPVFYSASRKTASYSNDIKIKPVDVVFIIDCTDNLKDNFENVKSNVISASRDIYDICDSARICVIQFWASKTPVKSNWFTNSQYSELENYVDSIEQSSHIENSLHGAAMTMAADLSYRSNAKKFSFLIFDKYSQWSEDMTGEMIENGIQKIVNKGINFSILYNHSRTTISDNSQNLISITNGYDGSNLGSFFVDVVSHILSYTDEIDSSIVEPENPEIPDKPDPPVIEEQPVDLSGRVIFSDFSTITIYGETTDGKGFKAPLIRYSDTDSDDDGLSDSYEVLWDKMLYNSKTNVYSCKSFPDEMIEINNGLGNINHKIINPLSGVKLLPIRSNPLKADSDDDGIADGPKDVLGNGRINDDNPLNITQFSQGYKKAPTYILDAIIFSKLLEEDKHLSVQGICTLEEDNKKSDAHYISSIYKYHEEIWDFHPETYYSDFRVKYYSLEESKTILTNLLGSEQRFKLILKFLDDISEPLGDPNMNLPNISAFVNSLYSFLRSTGATDFDKKTAERVSDFLKLYCKADGQTPLCTQAKLFILGWLDNEWHENRTYNRSYLPYGG